MHISKPEATNDPSKKDAIDFACLNCWNLKMERVL